MSKLLLLCLLAAGQLTVGAFVVSPRRFRSLSASQRHVLYSAAAAPADVESSTDEGLEEEDLPPGLREDAMFELDESVSYWKDFESVGNDENLRRIREILQKHVVQDDSRLSRAYWGSHVFRSGYFTLNAVLGSVASDLHERFIAPGATTKSSSGSKSDGGPVLSASAEGAIVERLLDSDIPSRLLLETAKTYEQDYAHIASGLLKYPWDALIQHEDESSTTILPGLLQLNHRQFNPFFVLSETARAVQESVGIFSRRNKGSTTKLWQPPQSNLYPEYYLNDFHYQTDGWLSSESANRYEVSTETLFLGRQDAMQRQTLLPLLKHSQQTKPPQRILEVACGTGRFGTFVRDNFPQANVTMTDLSPYYLEKARENDAYWRSFQKDTTLPAATFVQCNAESLPFDDNAFDAVVCVYLFHELPEDARKRAAAEMQRVCAPGGMIVLTDSLQAGDRLHFVNIRNFVKLNEPHHPNYVEEAYLPELFAGCTCDKKYMVSSTKTTSFLVEKK